MRQLKLSNFKCVPPKRKQVGFIIIIIMFGAMECNQKTIIAIVSNKMHTPANRK